MIQFRGLVQTNLLKHIRQEYYFIRNIVVIDKSKVPKIDEKDLNEQFIKGSGPGGSKINKSSNCVLLHHKPTGIIIKCQEDRDLHRNRKLARERLITKLDNLYNGEDSVENQKKQIQDKKNRDKKRKRERLLQLRERFKESGDNEST